MARYFALVEELYNDGARQFLFLNVPAVTRSPAISGGTEELVTKHANCVDVFNTALKSQFADFKSSHEDVGLFLGYIYIFSRRSRRRGSEYLSIIC